MRSSFIQVAAVIGLLVAPDRVRMDAAVFESRRALHRKFYPHRRSVNSHIIVRRIDIMRAGIRDVSFGEFGAVFFHYDFRVGLVDINHVFFDCLDDEFLFIPA